MADDRDAGHRRTVMAGDDEIAAHYADVRTEDGRLADLAAGMAAALPADARVLRPGGEALVVSGCEAWEGRNPDWLDTGTEMVWSFHGRERTRELLAAAGFRAREDEEIDDELGGSFCAFRAVVPEQ